MSARRLVRAGGSRFVGERLEFRRLLSPTPLPNDASTQLLLPFDNALTGVAGEVPTASAGTSFGAGQVGQAVSTGNPGYVRYATSGNITATAGTVEFWIKPTWNGNAGVTHYFFQAGNGFNNGMLLAIDGANNLRFIQWGDDPTTPAVEVGVERGAGASGSNWVAGTWYHVAATWDSATHVLAYYVNGQLKESASNGVTIPSFSTTYLEVGADIGNNQVGLAAFDELRISSRARTASEVAADYQLGLTGATLTAPVNQRGVAGDASVQLKWTPIADPLGIFQQYRIYRSTASFSSVAGLTPIASVADLNAGTFADATAQNGVAYYYAVTAAGGGVSSGDAVVAVGPRKPRSETDLQVVSVARAVQYPRYAPTYTSYTVTEPGGFGPYNVSAATGLGGGQTAATKHLPTLGESTTYVATVRNRGTNAFAGNVTGTFTLDGTVVLAQGASLNLAPGQTATYSYTRAWDDVPHELDFSINVVDARPANNALASDTMAVPYMTYLDQSFVEDFRDRWSPVHGGIQTDDLIDWLNDHMTRFNALFAAAGTHKRVGYGVLQVIDDPAADPATDRSPYAIFPFRYRAGTDGDPRAVSAYYHPSDDIDYGLLHEMGHQLGLIDEYQLNVDASSNLVNGQGYSVGSGLMADVSSFLSADSAGAMEHWLHVAHGYFGQYLYALPQTMNVRVLGTDGLPLAGASVTVYQKTDVPGVGQRITTQAKAQGVTNAGGVYALPNVPLDPTKIPTTFAGDTLHDNPFGYLDCVGSNGVLLLKIAYGGRTAYAWLDAMQANVAYFQGQTTSATFDRQVGLGGAIQTRPPIDMTENNAADWNATADGSTATATTDVLNKIAGGSSVRFDTAGGFDTSFAYPKTALADWDLTTATALHFGAYAQNTNSPTFQNGSPWIKLTDINGNVYQYQYFTNNNVTDLYSTNLNVWKNYAVPLNASATTANGWRRTQVLGTGFDFAHVTGVDFHADTWGYGFSVTYDDVGFDLATPGGNSVTLAGTAGADAFAVRQQGDGSIDVFVIVPTTGSPNYHFAAGQLASLVLAGGAGDDAFTMLTSLPFAPACRSTGHATLNVAAGTFAVAGDLAVDAPDLTVNVAAGASVAFNASQTLSGLSLAGSASAALQAGGGKVLRTRSLAVAGAARLDLRDGNLILDYGGPTPQADAVRQLIAAGRAGGAWTGPGITSTSAGPNTTLGYMEATDYKALYGPTATFAGQTIDDSAVLVRYTVIGDATLDGAVNFSDLLILAQYYGTSGRQYRQGDLDYSPDGRVDFADLLALAQHYGTSLPSLAMADLPAAAASGVGRKGRAVADVGL